MTSAALTAANRPADTGQYRRAERWSWPNAILAVCVFLGGFVIFEPAPYELALAPVLCVWFLFGLTLRTELAPLIVLLILMQVGGLIAATQTTDWSDIPLYMSVSIFLAATSIFFAAVVTDHAHRLAIIRRAWIVAGIAVAGLGILGYFHAFPGAELFTLYGRARGPFADPNVYGPFLAFPIAWLTREILTRPLDRVFGPSILLAVIMLGVFLSFSRAAWGLSGLMCILVAILVFLNEAKSAKRMRLVVLAVIGTLCLALLIIAALSIEQVADLFAERAKLVQDYDGERHGRFDRYWIGFALAAERPLGIGALEFGKDLGEDPHNTILKSLLAYGWLGFAAYVSLIGATLYRAFAIMFKPRPWAGMMQCLYVVLVGHLVIGMVIDTDHWRHYYMVIGLIWGIIAIDMAHTRRQLREHLTIR